MHSPLLRAREVKYVLAQAKVQFTQYCCRLHVDRGLEEFLLIDSSTSAVQSLC